MDANSGSKPDIPKELDFALRPPEDSHSPAAKNKAAQLSTVPEFARASGTSTAGNLAKAGIPAAAGVGGGVVPAFGEETESQVSSRIRQLLASGKQGPVFTERASARGAGPRSDVISATIAKKSDDTGDDADTDGLHGEPAESTSLAELVKRTADANRTVVPVAFQADGEDTEGATRPEELPEELPVPTGDDGEAPITGLLDLETVLVSTTVAFPAIREAAELRAEALGGSMMAFGAFDDVLEAFTINQPMGFYENYRHGINWRRPLWNGGTAYAGYRIGRGQFEPWYKERDTDNSGEFSVGFEIPLLQNRAIDPRRTAIRLAAIDIQRASPQLYQQILGAHIAAADAYWQWVAAGMRYEVVQELMQLAEVRIGQIERLIEEGFLGEVVAIDNRRLLTERRNALIIARQQWDNAAVELSLYYRDQVGAPITVSDNLLPEQFPRPVAEPEDLEDDISRALQQRPELAILQLTNEQLAAELRLAINQQLPEVTFGTEASKDIGPLTTPLGDKRPFELEAGLIGSVPVQRRQALGRQRVLRAQMAQLDARVQLTSDQIANEIRQATIIYRAARDRYEQARIARELASETLRLGGIQFQEGDIDILLLNIYEQAFATAQNEIIEAQAAMQTALAAWRAARGEMLLIDSPGGMGVLPWQQLKHLHHLKLPD